MSTDTHEPTHALVTRPAAGMPVMSVEDAVSRHNQLVKLVGTLLREGTDFGIIPGTSGKKTLYKPGAEKLCTFFGMCVDFQRQSSSVEDWDKGLFHYCYRAELTTKGGDFICAAEGSANSREKKHRYRNVYENNATDEDRKAAVGRAKKRGDRGEYWVLLLPNPDIYDVVNTLQKMAQKRALVASVLVAVGASEMFTQDLEEIPVDEGDAGDPGTSRAGKLTRRIASEAKPRAAAPVRSFDDWIREVHEVAGQRGFANEDVDDILRAQAQRNQIRLPGDDIGEWHDFVLTTLKNGGHDAILEKRRTARAGGGGLGPVPGRQASADSRTEKGVKFETVTPGDIDSIFAGAKGGK